MRLLGSVVIVALAATMACKTNNSPEIETDPTGGSPGLAIAGDTQEAAAEVGIEATSLTSDMIASAGSLSYVKSYLGIIPPDKTITCTIEWEAGGMAAVAVGVTAWQDYWGVPAQVTRRTVPQHRIIGTAVPKHITIGRTAFDRRNNVTTIGKTAFDRRNSVTPTRELTSPELVSVLNTVLAVDLPAFPKEASYVSLDHFYEYGFGIFVMGEDHHFERISLFGSPALRKVVAAMDAVCFTP